MSDKITWRGFVRKAPRRLLGLAITAVAAVWSFDSLRNLAEYVGFGPLAWMFPICVDAVAAYGMDVWMRREPAWKAGRALAFLAVGVSLAGNVADWALHGSHVLAPWMAAVPPAALAAILGIMHSNARGHDEADQAAAEAEQVRTRAEAEREARRTKVRPKQVERSRTEPQVVQPKTVTELSPVSRGEIEPGAPSTETTPITRKRRTWTDAELAEALTDLIARHGEEIARKRRIMQELGIGSDTALRALRLVKAENDDETEEVG